MLYVETNASDRLQGLHSLHHLIQETGNQMLGDTFCRNYRCTSAECFHDGQSCSKGSTTAMNLLCPTSCSANRILEGGLRRGYITTRVLCLLHRVSSSEMLIEMCRNIGLRPRWSVFGPGRKRDHLLVSFLVSFCFFSGLPSDA